MILKVDRVPMEYEQDFTTEKRQLPNDTETIVATANRTKYAIKWALHPDTKIRFEHLPSNFFIVDTKISYPLTSIKFKLIEDFAGIEALFTHNKEYKIDQLKLEEKIRQFLKLGAFLKATFKLTLRNEEGKDLKLFLKILDMKTEEQSLPKFEYGFKGQLTEKTQFEFIQDNNKLELFKSDTHTNDNEVDLTSKDPLQHLQELGMGGLSDSFKTIIQNVLLSRSHLKSEMDGLHQMNNFLFIGITNRIDQLDPAAVRSGRFGVAVEIGPPDKEGRKQIFDIYAKKVKEENLLSKDVILEKYVVETEGFTGADIKALVNRACSFSLQRLFSLKVEARQIESPPQAQVTVEDFDTALYQIKKELQNKPGLFYKHS